MRDYTLARQCDYSTVTAGRAKGSDVIYVVKSQSFLRTPLVSMIVEGEDWFVGFDEVFESMPSESVLEFTGDITYPASRLIAHDGKGYRIELSLLGFEAAQPKVRLVDGFVVVTGNKTEYAIKENSNYLQKGISAQGFRRSFQLGRDHRFAGSNLHQGKLQIEVEQAIPAAVAPVVSWVRAG